jgi:hypothetical protein
VISPAHRQALFVPGRQRRSGARRVVVYAAGACRAGRSFNSRKVEQMKEMNVVAEAEVLDAIEAFEIVDSQDSKVAQVVAGCLSCS